MKKLNDIIYNLNDVLVAIVIVIVAGFVITWRVDKIMNYSSIVGGDEQEISQDIDFTDIDLTTGDEDPNTEVVSGGETGEGGENQNLGENTTGGQDEPFIKPDGATVNSDTKFTVPSGASSDKIANLLQEKGLVSDSKLFLREVSAQGVETKLKAGDFTIPAGSSMSDIVKILSK